MSDFTLLRGATMENVLTMLLWNERYAPMFAAMLTPDLFGDKNQERIAEEAIKFIEVYHRPPRGHIRDLLEPELRRQGGNSELLMALIDASERLDPELDTDYVVAELDKFIRIRRRKLAMERASRLLDEGDETAADEEIWQHAIVPSKHNDMSPGVYLHDTDLSFLAQTDTDRFTSGVQALDDKGIVPARGTMTMFIAPKKAGKSWCCVNVGKSNMIQGKRVLHISLENSEALTKRRYIQAVYSMTKKQVNDEFHSPALPGIAREYTEIELKPFIPLALTIDNQRVIVKRLQALKYRPPLLIKQFPAGTLTVPRLHAYIDHLTNAYKFKPDVLIVDYPDLMHIDSRNMRVDTGRVFVALRGLAVDRELALFVPTQGNRESQDARIVTSKHVSEDWSKAGTADTVLTFNRTKQERECGLARIWVDAARDEEDSFGVMITQAYTIGQFCIDSTFMDARMTDESNKIIDNKATVAEMAKDQEED